MIKNAIPLTFKVIAIRHMIEICKFDCMFINYLIFGSLTFISCFSRSRGATNPSGSHIHGRGSTGQENNKIPGKNYLFFFN